MTVITDILCARITDYLETRPYDDDEEEEEDMCENDPCFGRVCVLSGRESSANAERG